MIVLLINDHLLKQAWPGFVTGKLSDVAGLVVAPALLALLFWRRADLAATVLTGVLFALVKTTETGAEIASHAWTLVAGPSRVLADPTDLLALPVLALAWWVRRRSLHSDSARLRIMVAVPLAVLAVTATSGVRHPTAHSVEVAGNRIIVHMYDTSSRVSEDGGLTWSVGTTDDRPKPAQSAACVPMQATRCYRVVPDRMAVEQSDDGGRTWGPSWAMSEDDVERLNRTYSNSTGQYSMALAAQPRPGGHVVVVANGLDGILVRDVQGTWRRVGWPGSQETAAVEAPAMDLSPERNVALFLAACVLFGGVGAGLRQFHRVYTGFAAAACLGFFAVLSAGRGADPLGLAGLFASDLNLEALLGIGVSGMIATVVGTVVCLVLALAGRARPVTAAVGATAAPLVYAGVYLPFYGWSAGVPGAYWAAVAIAVLLTALVLLASVALIRNDARRYYLDGSSTSSPT
ncbi:hypothetical protein ACFLIM_35200 [Nonomuraea sp. M3C6]|uniref:Uncharacterized protein n=1 Tax=Nonomuraea marmarensis TaxID=3351344 RepID=A0ABW7APW5_9ACTN